MTFLISMMTVMTASAGDVLHYYGNNTGTYRGIDPDVAAALISAGAGAVDDTTTWPSSLSGYQLIILSAGYGTATAFSSGQVADLSAHLSAGGCC